MTALLAAALLGGCASLNPDGAHDGAHQRVRGAMGKDVVLPRPGDDARAVDEHIARLLAKPLQVDDAVQLALLANPSLRAAGQELVVADAERVQASRLPNPGVSLARLRRGHEVEIERGLHFGLARLVAMPWLRESAERQLAQAQAALAARALTLAADTRKAWVDTVAAQQSLAYAKQVMDAADAGAELARRMAQVGNFSRLQQAREQAFHAEAVLDVARATRRHTSTRERLTRLMGLWGEQTAFTLPERLPDLPAQPADQPRIEQTAIAQRLDVHDARVMVERQAQSLGLSKATRFVNVLELGVMRNSSNEEAVQRGVEVSFELPLFDWGEARVARAQALYMQAVHRAADTAIQARSEVREAYLGYRLAWDVARHHRDELLPLKRRISDENLLRYNGMLIGVFELLADVRAQIVGVNASIEALRDFWLAQADLDMALVGKPGLTLPTGAALGAAAPAGDAH